MTTTVRPTSQSEKPRPLAPAPEPVGDCGGHDHHGQTDEPEREAEQTDVVADAEIGDPGVLLLELDLGATEVEAGQARDPEGELGQGEEERERADPHPGSRQ